MMLMVNQRLQKYIKSTVWRGRCGAVHLYLPVSPYSFGFNIFCVGVHGAHGELFPETLADLSFLVKSRPFQSQVIILGDWNVDLLPSLACDPWGERAERSLHHLEQRVLFDTFLDQFDLHLSIPSVFDSVPGGPFGRFCFQVPITRIPVGEQINRCLPSLLDFGASSRGMIAETSLFWDGAPADHALVSFKCIPVFVKQAAAKTRWICTDTEECIEWLAQKSVLVLNTLEDFNSFLLDCQHYWADLRSCRARRHNRLPLQLRDIYARMGQCTNESNRRALQKTAWTFVTKLHQKYRDQANQAKVRRGGVINRAKKLHRIREMILPDKSRTTDTELWSSEVSHRFRRKWGCNAIQRRACILDYVHSCEGMQLEFDAKHLRTACETLRNKTRLDHFGISPEIIRLF